MVMENWSQESYFSGTKEVVLLFVPVEILFMLPVVGFHLPASILLCSVHHIICCLPRSLVYVPLPYDLLGIGSLPNLGKQLCSMHV